MVIDHSAVAPQKSMRVALKASVLGVDSAVDSMATGIRNDIKL